MQILTVNDDDSSEGNIKIKNREIEIYKTEITSDVEDFENDYSDNDHFKKKTNKKELNAQTEFECYICNKIYKRKVRSRKYPTIENSIFRFFFFLHFRKP